MIRKDYAIISKNNQILTEYKLHFVELTNPIEFIDLNEMLLLKRADFYKVRPIRVRLTDIEFENLRLNATLKELDCRSKYNIDYIEEIRNLIFVSYLSPINKNDEIDLTIKYKLCY